MDRGLVVDIDDTLSDTAKYWMYLFQREFGNPENFSVQEMYDKYHYVQNVPYWQSSEINSVVHQFINGNIFQRNIPLIENANIVLSNISKIIPVKCYLTKRPECVRISTELWLKKHNFPKAELILKPNSVDFSQGNHWKNDYVESNKSTIFGIIDDDEDLISTIKRTDSLYLFLFGKRHIPSPILQVYPCYSWQILEEIFFDLIDRK